MLSRLRESLSQANKALLAVLAVLVVLVFAWVVFGLIAGGDSGRGNQGEQVANQEVVAQAQDDGTGSPAPEAENRNADSYAAYEAKDPFRQIVKPADSGNGDNASGSDTEDGTGSGDSTSEDSGTDSGDSSSNGSGNGSGTGGETTSGGGSQGGQSNDSDRDKVSNNREKQLGLDPTNPDTDGDSIRDGADDSNGDGRPDRDIGGRGGSPGGRGGGTGGNDGLFDSGGSLLPSGK